MSGRVDVLSEIRKSGKNGFCSGAAERGTEADRERIATPDPGEEILLYQDSLARGP